MLKRGLVLISLLISLPLGWAIYTESTFADNLQGLVISEVKAKNEPAGLNEFVELFNNSEQPISLSQYKLEYDNVYNPSASQAPTASRTFTDVTLGPFEYYLLARDTSQIEGSVSLSPISSLKDDEGRLRLIGPDPDNAGQIMIYDEIAWNSSTSTKSWQRFTSQEASPVVFEAAWIEEAPNPAAHLYIEQPSEDDPFALTCEGIIITEILPNPASTDAGKEFIELYNPTNEIISLLGCSLQTTANSHVYDFNDVSILPSSYLSLYDSQTDLTLANAAGGTVWLLSPTEELQAISYPENLDDDVAWAHFNDLWQITFQPTPGAANIIISTKPCPEGQIRNPETGRCRSILSSIYSLEPCQAGYERNPVTNRCRKIDSESELTPCKPGQYRNPETNRCRKIDRSELKPCAPGQFRNPETNRCKKLPAGSVAGATEVKDVQSPSVGSSIQWGLAGAVSLGAIGFGLYEWRQDILNALRRLRNRN